MTDCSLAKTYSLINRKLYITCLCKGVYLIWRVSLFVYDWFPFDFSILSASIRMESGSSPIMSAIS